MLEKSYALKGTQGKIGKIHFPPTSFEYSSRTAESFEAHARLGTDDCPYMGVFGPTKLSNHVPLPSAVVLDKMHLIDLGQFKRYLSMLFFNVENKFDDFYLGLFLILSPLAYFSLNRFLNLGRKRKAIQERINLFKFPSSINRINFDIYKCSNWKVIE
jgi:hypothetical protein